MIHIKKNFITNGQREIILRELSSYYVPLDIGIPGTIGVETALGFDPNSKDATMWTKDKPIRAFNGNFQHDEALSTIFEVYNRVAQELEKTYNHPMRLVNCILNKMTEGNFNSMHTDDQPQYKDPVHTAIVYLSGQNVDFTGGEIYFQVENYLISPERNMLVFFEGNVQRPHEVKTVVSGVRQTITMQFTKEEQ